MKRILIADDQHGIRFFLNEVFKDLYQVVIAENGKIALEQFEKGKFDLVLTDMKMPELDGLGLVRGIREQDKDVPILVMTAYSENETALELEKLNISGAISKPFDIQEVKDLVKKNLAQGETREK